MIFIKIATKLFHSAKISYLSHKVTKSAYTKFTTIVLLFCYIFLKIRLRFQSELLTQKARNSLTTLSGSHRNWSAERTRLRSQSLQRE